MIRKVEIVPPPATRQPSPATRLDSEMYQVLEVRAKGQQSYGIGLAGTLEDRLTYGAHSRVERLAETSTYSLVEFVWNAVTEIAGSKR
jgi:hypothetical protein